MNVRTATKLLAGVFSLMALLCSVSPLAAQQEWDPRRVYMTREALQELLDRLELTAQSPAYSRRLRERTRAEADLIRARLRDGDFQVGDRILLTVEEEPALTDTFLVDQGRLLRLPVIGDVSLAGLLRAELEPHLSEYVSRFIRDPRVRAQSLIPVTIEGAVGSPGFYTVPSELRLTDALMLAGGPSPTARITDIEVRRGEDEIWEAEPLQEAITEGRTLDQLSLRGGDRIFVPERRAGFSGPESTVRTIGYLLAIPITIVALIRIF